MDKTCGNCAMVLEQTKHLVKCRPDLLPAVWHSKGETCKNCLYFKAKHHELQLRMVELQVEYYKGENKTPISVVAKCADGNTNRLFIVNVGKVMQVRMAGWVNSNQFYTEGEFSYRREIWRPRHKETAAFTGLSVVVSTKDEI